MKLVLIILVIIPLLYLCDHWERKDPHYWDACRGVHPSFHLLIAPVCLVIRLLTSAWRSQRKIRNIMCFTPPFFFSIIFIIIFLFCLLLFGRPSKVPHFNWPKGASAPAAAGAQMQDMINNK